MASSASEMVCHDRGVLGVAMGRIAETDKSNEGRRESGGEGLERQCKMAAGITAARGKMEGTGWCKRSKINVIKSRKWPLHRMLRGES